MMTKMQMFEFGARLIAWLGSFVFLTGTIWHMIQNSDSPITYSYFIFPLAVYITGFFDMIKFHKRERKNI